MKVIKAEDTRSLEPFRDRIIEGDCLEVMKGIIHRYDSLRSSLRNHPE